MQIELDGLGSGSGVGSGIGMCLVRCEVSHKYVQPRSSETGCIQDNPILACWCLTATCWSRSRAPVKLFIACSELGGRLRTRL